MVREVRAQEQRQGWLAGVEEKCCGCEVRRLLDKTKERKPTQQQFNTTTLEIEERKKGRKESWFDWEGGQIFKLLP